MGLDVRTDLFHRRRGARLVGSRPGADTGMAGSGAEHRFLHRRDHVCATDRAVAFPYSAGCCDATRGLSARIATGIRVRTTIPRAMNPWLALIQGILPKKNPIEQ